MSIIRLYKAFIRTHLEYCASVWCPYYEKDINTLEKVQRRMTKQPFHLKKLNYLLKNERLLHLKLTTLKVRRLRYDLIIVYKLLNGFLDVDPDHFFLRLTKNVTRGHTTKLFVNFSRLNIRKNFFSQRVVTAWNSLPESCVNAPDPDSFKKLLDRFLSHHYCAADDF